MAWEGESKPESLVQVPALLSRMVSKWIKQADIQRPGSCHLLRHTSASNRLEGRADICFIPQLKPVHSKTHPVERPKNPDSQNGGKPLC